MVKVMEKVAEGFNGKRDWVFANSSKLESGLDVYAETKSWFHETRLQAAPASPRRFWYQSHEVREITLFHEATHFYGTDDNVETKNPFNEAAHFEPFFDPSGTIPEVGTTARDFERYVKNFIKNKCKKKK
jgi:hypothetical protein